MESKLNKQQLEHLRGTLRDRRRELLDEIRAELSESDDQSFQDLAGRVHDNAEASVADLLSDLNLAIIDQHIGELRATEESLERMEEGAYGTCVECAKAIGYERLQAYPTATRCIEHQRLYEKTHAGEEAPRL